MYNFCKASRIMEGKSQTYLKYLKRSLIRRPNAIKKEVVHERQQRHLKHGENTEILCPLGTYAYNSYRLITNRARVIYHSYLWISIHYDISDCTK